MQRGLVRRYFTMCCSIILTSIILLGVIFMVFAAQYFKEDKLGALEKNAKYAAEMTERYIISVDGRYQLVNNALLTSSWIPMAKALDADIYLANLSGDVLLCTHRSTCNHMVYGIEEEMIQKVKNNGCYTEVGKMGEIYKSSYYTAGVPLTLSDGQIAGVIFASSSAQGLTEFMGDILKMFLLSALVMLVVTFALVYVVTGNMVRPLREMLKATEAFAKGDFSVRVPIREQDEIGKLSMAFNNMADSLAQQETVRRSFIANVSHELKTPMTSIAGFIDGILDGTIPPERERHYLTLVSDEVKRLSRLVRSMLNIAKIEAGEMKLNPTVFDVNESVLSSIFTFEQTIDAKHLEIRGLEDTGKIMVEADQDLIHQVVYNLLENAVKFANEGGYVEVSYTVDSKRTYINIKNSGDGIPKDEISKVFDRFYKTDRSRSMDKTGVGLGLYIVRSIVNVHQGEVIVRSVEGEYCEFSFSVATAPKALTRQPKPVSVREV